MEVEHVAGVSFSPWRAMEQQTQLTVGHCVMGQIVINDQHMAALIHQVFAHGGAGIGRDIQHRRRIGGFGADNDTVVHSAQLPKLGHDTGHGGLLLSYGHIDTDDVLALLVDYGVDGNGSLTGLPVADYKLTLAPADRHQGIDGLYAGVQRHRHRLSCYDTGGRALHRPRLGSQQGASSVHGVAHAVHYTAYKAFAHRHFHDLPGTAYLGALMDILIVTQEHGTDPIFFDVHNHALEAVLKAYHFPGHNVGETHYVADAVGKALHDTGLEAAGFVGSCGKLILKVAGNILAGTFSGLEFFSHPTDHVLQASVVYGVLQLQTQTAYEFRVHSDFKAELAAGLILQQGLHLFHQALIQSLSGEEFCLQLISPAELGLVAVCELQHLLQLCYKALGHGAALSGIFVAFQQLCRLLQQRPCALVSQLSHSLLFQAEHIVASLTEPAVGQCSALLGAALCAAL